jgi:hypothetical protein
MSQLLGWIFLLAEPSLRNFVRPCKLGLRALSTKLGGAQEFRASREVALRLTLVHIGNLANPGKTREGTFDWQNAMYVIWRRTWRIRGWNVTRAIGVATCPRARSSARDGSLASAPALKPEGALTV